MSFCSAKRFVARALVALGISFAGLGVVAEPIAFAQPKPAATASATPAEHVAPDSPRASYSRFTSLCHEGEFGEASLYLDVPDREKSRALELTRRLYTVLDRVARLKLERLSPDSMGDASDRMPPGVDQIATIASANGPEPVRLVRRATPDGTRWLFSRSTVDRVDHWFDALDGRWAEDAFPQPLLRQGPEDLLLWQWIALPLLFVASWGVGRLLAYATGRLASRVIARRETRSRDALQARLGTPIAFAWALLVVHFALPYLALASDAVAFIHRCLVAGALVAFFWILLRTVDLVGVHLVDGAPPEKLAAVRSLVPLGTKTTKIVVFSMAVIAALGELGYPVTSLIAGLGIGGVALALAAQKTVENLFGSVSIGIDQPFRVGDLVQVDGLSGTIESIGLRSTRLRTQDRTLVTLPNGKLADSRIECVTSRDRMRFSCTLPLDPSTSADAMRKILGELHSTLVEHPRAYQEDITVALMRITPSSLDIESTAWLTTTVYEEFLTLRQDLLLRFLEIVTKAGAHLSSPVQELRIERQPRK